MKSRTEILVPLAAIQAVPIAVIAWYRLHRYAWYRYSAIVTLKVYKELERMLKVSEIKMSVDKVLALAKTITTIQIKLPQNKEVYTQTMLMARHQKIAKLFDKNFWVTQ